MHALLNAKGYCLTVLALFLSISVTTANGASFYNIEMIIFERFSQSTQATWQSSRITQLPNATASLSPSNSTLPKANLLKGKRFNAIASTLKKKGAVVHTHARWRQAVKNRKTPHWLSVDNQRLRGAIQVSRGRYLHFNTDLYLQRPGAEYPDQIKLHRRMRSGETHYVDHPKLGIILRAQPVITAKTQPQPLPKVPTQPEPVSPKPKPDGNSLPRALPDPS